MGTGLQTFTADDGTTLTRNTRYFVHINFSGSGTRPRWNLATDDREDSGKAIGWSIGNHRYTRQSGETGGWEGDGGVYSGSIQIRVQGDTLAPAAPTNLSATPGETRVVLTWDNPANNTITRYQYRRKTGTGAYGNWTDISGSGASTTAYTVTGLTSSTAYTFEVRAKNVGGNGEAATVTTATLPAAPTNLWPDPGDGAVTLSWTNPGGDTIASHEVSTDGGTTFSDIPNSAHGQTNATGYTVTGLTNGTEYTFKLRARNNSGEGAASTATATPRAPPDAPDGLSATAGDGQVTLSWTNWGDNTIWKYQVSTDGGSNYTDINGSSWTTTTHTVTGLSNGTQYTLALRAVNAYGNGDPANAPAIPLWPAPANLSVTPGEDRKATLTWDDPADSTIAKYQVSTDGGVNYTDIIGSSAATTTHEVTGLTNGTAYTLALRAANDLAGGTAAAITATPLWPAPKDLKAVPGNERVVLTWDTNTGITHYRVHWQATNSGAAPEILDVTAGSVPKTISNLTNGTEYTFTVQAVDASGSTAVITGLPSSATATPAPVPDAPTGLTPTARSQEVALTWTDPNDSTITKYQVSIDGGTNYTDISGSHAATTATTVTGLTNGTEYTLAVRAKNDSGDGLPDSATATPLWPAPTGLVATPDSGRVTLQWDTGDSEIALYAVRTTLTGTQVSDNAHQSGSGNKTTATVTGLTNGTEYTFTVRAASGTSANFQITGVASTDTPAAALPAKPTGLTPTARSQEVALTWTDPNNITITKYQVSTDAGTGTNYTDIPNSGQGQTNATGYTVTGLTNGIQYTFKLRAVNASGAGDASSVTATPIAKPAAPANFAATRGSDGGEVALTWDDPGNVPITGYQYRRKRGNRAFGDWTDIDGSGATTVSHTVTGLSNGRQHTVELRAVNASGEGAASSDTATPRWPAPTFLTVTPDHTRVHLEWEGVPGAKDYILTTSIGDVPDRTSFITLSEPASKVDDTVGIDADDLPPDTRLTNGTKYTFTVWSTTAGGTQTSVKSSVEATPVEPPLPDAPTISSATPGDSRVVLKWDDPGNITITKYQVRWKVKDSDDSTYTPRADITSPNPYATPPTPPTTYTATGLTNGTTYTFEVRAGNGSGEGPASTVDATPSAIPDAPENLSATAGDGQVALSWDKPSNDATIGNYTYEVSTDGGDNYSAIPDSDDETTAHTVMGLTNGTEYTFAVRAENDAGKGLAATVTATPIAVPAAPTALSATAGATEVALTWDDPDDDTITGYQVSTDGGETFADIDGTDISENDTDNTLAYTVTDLTNGTEYTFALRAKNASGVGAASTVTAPTLPAAPTGLMGTEGEDRQVTLSWDDPDNNTVSGYQVSTDGGTTFIDIEGSNAATTTHTVTVLSDGTGTGLTNGTEYTFKLRTVNASGNSAASPDATATPLWPAPENLAAALGDGQVLLTWDTGDPGIARYKVSTTYTSTGDTYLNTFLSPGSGDQTTVLIPGLTNRTDYTFTVQAVDTSGSTGTGLPSSVAATPVPVPVLPANLSPTAGNGQVVLTWDDPNDSSITKYQVRSKVRNSDDNTYTDWANIAVTDPDAPPTTYTVTGLTNGTEYTFAVRAVNASGDGDASSVSATPIAVPNAPKNLMATPGDRRAALEWDTPSNGIIPITKYQYSTDDGTTFVDIAGSSAATITYTVEFLSNPGTPLTNGTEYTFAVRAVNDLGPGLSAIDSATPITVPAAPAISSVKPGNRQVALDWANPNDSTIARYQISTDDGTTYTTIEGSGAATTTHTVIVLSDGSGTRLSNGTEYMFAVRAVNAVGEGDASSANATPFDNPLTGSGKKVVAFEDTAYAFKAADFRFSGGENVVHVKITWLPKPKEGTLSLRGTAITSATLPQLTLAELGGGQFTYMPPTDANGSAFASFGFRVNDGEPTTMTIDVTPVNDAPTASDGTVSTDEDTAYAFEAAEFDFSDVDGDTLDHVKITSLPETNQGTLWLDGTAITGAVLPQRVRLAELDDGKLIYTPPAKGYGEAFASFGFKVNDGEADSALAYTITIAMGPVGGAPTASDKTVFTFENTAYTFKASDFGFSEADDTLDHVKITSLPETNRGMLSLDGTAITSAALPRQVTQAELGDGQLTYRPPANVYGKAFASFDFRVNDGEPATMTIDVVPVLSVSFGGAVYVADEGGDEVVVKVRLDRRAIVALTIPITIIPRGETVAADYQVDGLDTSTDPGVAGTLTFGAGEDTRTFTIKAEQDDDFDNETVMLGFGTLSAGAEAGEPPAATLTITDGGGVGMPTRFRRLNDEILSKHALIIADTTNRAIGARMDEACGQQAAAYRLAGGSTIYDTLQSNAPALADGTLTLADVLAGSSFLLAADDGLAGVGGPVLWGRGDRHRLESKDSAFAWDGTVLTGQIGIDGCPRDDLWAGLTLSRSIGEFDYTDKTAQASVSGGYESRMTSVHPYLGWSSAQGLNLWATVGYGRGDIEIDDEQVGRQLSSTTLTTVALGASGPVLADGLLLLKAEAMVAQVRVKGNDDLIDKQRVHAQRLRLALEGSHEWALSSGGSLTPSLELGLRHDGGDGAIGGGIEVGGSLRFQNPATGLTIEGRGRILTGQSDYREWGLGGSFRYDPGAAGRGLSVSLAPSWGETASGVAGLWDQDVAALPSYDRTASDSGAQGRLEGELGYGLSAFGGQGLLTPYGGFSLVGDGRHHYRIGSRFEMAWGLNLSLEGERRESANAAAVEHGVMLRGQIQF